ncbi:Hypothetical protein A7982_00590 [Minicystis rosea]|nr:Hypothetical protein A7982_00590 [Minicystis rosea]
MWISPRGQRTEASKMRSRWFGQAVIAAAIVTSALAAGEARAETKPIRIEYLAHPSCPGLDVLVEEITWRTSRARLAAPGEDAFAVRARITKSGALLRGRLTLGKGREAITREIEGASCDEVVSALALVTALAIDPHASTSRKPPPAPPPPPPPPRFTLPERPLVPDTLPAPAPAEILAAPLPVVALPPAPPSASPWSMGARALVALAVTPRPLIGGSVFVDRILSRHWGASLRLAAEVGATGAFEIGPGSAAFVRAAGRFDACAFALRPTPRLSIQPCVAAEAGVLRGEGIPRGSLTTGGVATVPWIALDFLPRAAFAFDGVSVEVQAGPAFPLVRREFLFERPELVVHALPPVTFVGSIGAGFHFP